MVRMLVRCGIAIESVPTEPIFEKCSHLREKGGVLTLRTPVGFALTPTVPVMVRCIFAGLERGEGFAQVQNFLNILGKTRPRCVSTQK